MSILRKLYPNTLNKWRLILLISLFIGLFLYIFQPFGLQLLEIEHKGLRLAGYGLVTFFVLLFNMKVLPLLFPKLFYDENWTVLSQIVWLLWIVLTISVANYSYSVAFSIVRWVGIHGLLLFLAFTFLVAIIPVTLITFISQNVYLRKNISSSADINNSIARQTKKTGSLREMVVLDSGKQSEEFNKADIIFLESEGNYIKIWYLEEDKIRNKMIRNTMKSIESLLPDQTSLFKCHRAFIINLDHVEQVKGNSQGYSLHLKGIKDEIPVARSYTKDFKNNLLYRGNT